VTGYNEARGWKWLLENPEQGMADLDRPLTPASSDEAGGNSLPEEAPSAQEVPTTAASSEDVKDSTEGKGGRSFQRRIKQGGTTEKSEAMDSTFRTLQAWTERGHAVMTLVTAERGREDSSPF